MRLLPSRLACSARNPPAIFAFSESSSFTLSRRTLDSSTTKEACCPRVAGSSSHYFFRVNSCLCYRYAHLQCRKVYFCIAGVVVSLGTPHAPLLSHCIRF